MFIRFVCVLYRFAAEGLVKDIRLLIRPNVFEADNVLKQEVRECRSLNIQGCTEVRGQHLELFN